MSEDSFIHEVTEELKQEKISAAWRKYALYIISAPILVVLIVAIYQIYIYSADKKSAKLGDSMLDALALSDSSAAQALPKLKALEAKNSAYAYLARFREAAILQSQNKLKESSKIYEALIKDSKIPNWFKDVARVKKAYSLIDISDVARLKLILEPCLKDGNHFQPMAYEVLGLSALKAKNLSLAKNYFKLIVNNPLSPKNLMRRAAMMLWVIEVEKSNSSNES